MQRLLARRLSVLAMAGTGSSASALPQLERFERALSSVDIAVEPRVQLVPPAVGGGEWPLPLDESVAVLDSSFNPPTCAHVHLLRSAAARFGVRRRMLLLAKQNADKPVVGASLPHRLQMMELLAREEVEGSTVCGVTAHPLFVDKARALRALCGPDATIFLLVGYDTWERVVDPKYYPEGRRDDALRSLFGTVVVTSRDSASASTMAPGLSAEGQASREGSWPRERAAAAVRSGLPAEVTHGRLHFMPNDEALAAVSSSAARGALAGDDPAAAAEVLPDCIRAYAKEHGLYE
ncbi:putative cytidylyltransferase [Emiliania huxleyi CCMP1516]|uniref:Cytidyltransferase-like domain-containing protein n=2 Tax=Emiliania huxleyi TaxID=2903 RepID=A0A0D3IVV1_EMIH1|nr:putative cytidylyltransferase [Emiliania huxleyi CCMP1516]EOD15386.1 putative cytidylyltransferase [Emiliania huxleyi CCMP1516]|eukprot:XP_005767815.1 putative cytidylyltransferase [Emiliania huxleyi CCMP1516]